MLKLLYAYVLNSGIILFLVLGTHMKVKASHAMGADLSYACVNPATNTYRITLKFYRDCSGIDVPPNILLEVNSATCGQSFTADLLQEPCPPNTQGGQPCEVSPLCFSSINQSTCNGGTLPGVQAFTYSAEISFPLTCTDWALSVSISARNDQITNLVNANSEDLYVQTTLNNVIYSCNNSPVFTTLPVPYICANQPFFYNHGAVDADGDSLVYSLVNPLGINGLPIAYANNYTPNSPMSLSGVFNFNTQNGQMNFTPNGVQVAVVTVLVKEYRNGVLIGSTMRDIQFVVVNLLGCANPTPTFSGAISNTLSGGIFINPFLLQVCPGNLISFSTLSIEGGGDSIFVETNIGQAIPGATYTTQYVKRDSVYGYFSWIPTALDTGQRTFIVNVKNNQCPIASSQAFAVTIEVLAGTYAGPDVAYCPAGGPVLLQAYGGSQFNWTPTLGLNNANIGNPKASPASTTTYIVTSNLSNNCRNTDTVAVFRVPDFTYTISQSDDTICRFEYVNISVNADAAFGPYTYLWTPNTSLNAATIANPVAQPDYTTVYQLVISSDTGCVIRDTTVKIVVSGQGPLVKITADKYKVCKGDTIQLSTKISSLPCGLNVVPCKGNYFIETLGTGTNSGHSPYFGLYEDARMQMLIRASELQALGMQAGTITDIAFDILAVTSSTPYNGFTIRMGCTNVNQLSGFVPGMNTVLVELSHTPNAGFNNHTLDTPYDWDGVSNLIVEVCFNNSSWTATDEVRSFNTGFTSVAYDFADGVIGCSLNSPALDSYRPNIQFVYCEALPKNLTYQWNPTSQIFSPDSLNPLVVLNESTTYYLTANDGSCSGGGSVSLTIDTGFGVTAGPDLPFCTGNPVQLSGGVYGSLPTINGNNCGTNASTCGTGASSQRTLTLAGSFSSTITPFDGGVFNPTEDQRTQILYRASDLLAAGFTAGTIRSIGFKITSKGSLLPIQNFSIKLGCSNLSELNDSAWENTSLVYSISALATVVGWNEWTLQSTYDWDGVSNLLVELCWDNPDGFISFGADLISAANVNYIAYHSTYAKVSSVGCNLPVPTFELYYSLPEFRAGMCPPPVVPVNYQWTPSANLSNDTISNPYASPSNPTTYYLTAYFGGRCPLTDSVIVTPTNVSISISNDTLICGGTSATLNVSGASNVTWNPATNISCTDCFTPVVNPDSTITYYVFALDSTTGCSVNDSVLVQVINLSASVPFTDTLIDQGSSITLFVNAQGSTSYNYLWSPSMYLSNRTTTNPVSTPVNDVVYTVLVSAGGCIDSAQINVRVNIVESPIAVPNAFSPNGDGKNDLFYPVMLNTNSVVRTFRIYNRYGQLVHNSISPWNGKLQGVDQPAGTFVYYIEIERPFTEMQKLEGAVTLIR